MAERASSEEKNIRTVFVGGLLILLVGGWFIGRAFWRSATYTEPVAETISPREAADDIPLITVETIYQKILNGERVTLLDVRREEDYQAFHIPHSLPLSSGALGSFVPQEGELVVIVLSWNDSQTKEVVKNLLRQKPFQAFLLNGGFEEWQRSGSQVITLGDPNSFLDQSKVTYISPIEALAMMNDPVLKPFILDVQTADQYQKVHVKGAINIPLEELEKRTKDIPAGKNILVYGDSELNSFRGGVRLADLNFFGARTIEGNSVLRPESGLPLEP
ncbi:MAG: rhodanese-like domain-containing protein [Candidatus Moranbacteria bacterium]|nr:rhodanese-like domain-containing protein [Candidatus Moranbacteria bacterium]